MQELGRILREKRESLGLSLDDVEDKTKIRKRYVEALESGDWSVLPGRVYARGFVRSYAEVLGLDGVELLQAHVDGQEIPSFRDEYDVGRPDDATIRVKRVDDKAMSETTMAARKPAAKMVEPRSLNEFQRQRAAEREIEDKPATTQRTTRTEPEVQNRPVTPPSPGNSRNIGGFVGQVAMIVGALVVIGGAYMFIHDRHQANGATTQNTSGGSIGTNSAMSNSASINNTANTAANSAGNQATNSVANNASAGGNSSLANNTTSAPPVSITAEPYANGQYTYVVQNVTSLQVQLKIVSGQCWIDANSDGKAVDPNDILNPGQTKTFTANQNVTIELGHVQGVQLVVNGQSVPLPVTGSAPTIVIQKQG